jgi:hypothetical protein
MDKVQKTSNSEFYTPSLESFRIGLNWVNCNIFFQNRKKKIETIKNNAVKFLFLAFMILKNATFPNMALSSGGSLQTLGGLQCLSLQGRRISWVCKKLTAMCTVYLFLDSENRGSTVHRNVGRLLWDKIVAYAVVQLKNNIFLIHCNTLISSYNVLVKQNVLKLTCLYLPVSVGKQAELLFKCHSNFRVRYYRAILLCPPTWRPVHMTPIIVDLPKRNRS